MVASPVCWSIPLLRSTILGKKKKSACGLDGVSRDDLAALKTPHLSSVLDLFARLERDVSWPQQPLVGAVKSLAKVECPGGTNDYRPITVLGMLYRVWGTVHARHWIRQLDGALDPFVMGNSVACLALHS